MEYIQRHFKATTHRRAPSPGLGENKSLKELVKRAGQIPWKRADLVLHFGANSLLWHTLPLINWCEPSASSRSLKTAFFSLGLLQWKRLRLACNARSVI